MRHLLTNNGSPIIADLARTGWTLDEETGLDKQPMYSFSRLGVYQQTPSTKVVNEAVWTPVERTVAAEQRIMALEADMARLEAIMDSMLRKTEEVRE